MNGKDSIMLSTSSTPQTGVGFSPLGEWLQSNMFWQWQESLRAKLRR